MARSTVKIKHSTWQHGAIFQDANMHRQKCKLYWILLLVTLSQVCHYYYPLSKLEYQRPVQRY